MIDIPAIRERVAQVQVVSADEGTAHYAIVVDGNYVRPATDAEWTLAEAARALLAELEDACLLLYNWTDEDEAPEEISTKTLVQRVIDWGDQAWYMAGIAEEKLQKERGVVNPCKCGHDHIADEDGADAGCRVCECATWEAAS